MNKKNDQYNEFENLSTKVWTTNEGQIDNIQMYLIQSKLI